MKYENGKIVTIKEKIKAPTSCEDNKINNCDNQKSQNTEVEIFNEKNFKTPNLTTSEQENPQFNIFNICKQIVNSKIIRWILGALVVSFFVLVLYDIYNKFTEPTSQIKTPNLENSHNIKSSSDNIDELSLDKGEQDTFKLLIKTANIINQIIVTNSNSELQQLDAYIDNKANIISTKNTLEEHFPKKEKAYIVLVDAKTVFEKEDAIEFYKATENRLLNSMNLTESTLSLLEQGGTRNDIEQEINVFLELETKYTQAQKDAFLKILDKRNIQYEHSSKTNKIEYIVD